MAVEKKSGSKPAAKGKKKGKMMSSLYVLSGEKIERNNRYCPKCGQGTFMAKHQTRLVCGKCRYVEMLAKK